MKSNEMITDKGEVIQKTDDEIQEEIRVSAMRTELSSRITIFDEILKALQELKK
jgi:hypothetical protein